VAVRERDLQERLRVEERRLEEVAQTATANRNRIRTFLDTTRSLREELDRVLARLEERPPAPPPSPSPATDREDPEPGDPAPEDPDPRESAGAPAEAAEPAPDPDPPADGEVPAPAEPDRPESYTVQRGDTLSDIARRFGVSLPALLAANPGLDPNLIQVGQELKLPAPGDS